MISEYFPIEFSSYEENDKELLIKDLCARLPHKVKINIPDMWNSTKTNIEVLEEVFCGDDGNYRCNNSGMLIDYCKPFLFPLSSMTEEQMFDFAIVRVDNLKGTYPTLSECSAIIDWGYKHHFDVNGLIEKGLAIDATGKNIY